MPNTYETANTGTLVIGNYDTTAYGIAKGQIGWTKTYYPRTWSIAMSNLQFEIDGVDLIS